jgi:hypothetical protein
MRNYGNNNTGKKLIVLNAIHMDKDKNKVVPHFTEMEKVDDKWETVRAETPLKGFSGTLIRVTPETKEFKDPTGKVIDTKESVKLLFDGGEENYLLSLTWRMASRNLFNSLLGMEKFDNLNISYYRNPSGYETFCLRQNDKIVKVGLLTNDEVKAKIKKVMLKGKETSDTYDLNEFLKGKLIELNEEISAAPAAETPVEKAPAKPTKKKVESVDLDEAPF